jgi:hypothetical protein
MIMENSQIPDRRILLSQLPSRLPSRPLAAASVMAAAASSASGRYASPSSSAAAWALARDAP